MNDRVCWNCGHFYEHHDFDGRCSHGAGGGGERCECPGFENSQYLGKQMKRDLYTLSDRRRLVARRRAG